MKDTLLVLGGAVLGGVVGYFAFHWFVAQGFYGLILPGGLLGFGAGIARNRSFWLAVACGLLATALGIFTEWSFRPFDKDKSLWFFLQHLSALQPVTLLMIGVGAFIGFWVPFRRLEKHARPRKEESDARAG